MTQPGERMRSAYEQWLAMQQEAEQHAPPIPSDFVGAPRYFKDPAPGQARSWVVPAGTPGSVAEDPWPGRLTAHDRRLAHAQLAREIAHSQQMAGTNTVSTPKEDARVGWHSVLVRNAATGTLETRWERDDGSREQVT